MELRHLRYFVAVAEELHFTRAAVRLGIKQPPLSVQIRQLEREMGAPLIRRLTRGIELTESGVLLLEESRRILGHAERIKILVQSRARGETGNIKIGFASGTDFDPLVPRIIRTYHDRYPGVALSMELRTTLLLAEGVRSGEIDVAFSWPPVGEGEGLVSELLVEEPMIVVMPAGHPLARHRAVPLKALASENFILFPRTQNIILHDAIIACCLRAGFSPRIGQELAQITPAIHLIAAGLGVSIMPRSMEQIRDKGVAYRRIVGDAPRAPIRLIFRRDEHSVPIRNFVALARRLRPRQKV